MPYNREQAAAYAHRWAFSRNPAYYDFNPLGGDCTNFISQCIHAGGAAMNYTPGRGWFYNSLSSRTPSWSGVEYLYNFLTGNQGTGPYAVRATAADMLVGDIVQLTFNGSYYEHSLFVVAAGIGENAPDNNNILTATHTFDSDYLPLNYWQDALGYRYLHILGAR